MTRPRSAVLRFRSYTLELRHAFGVASNTRTATPAVLAEVERDGITGHGEASLPPYLGETADSVCGFLARVDLARFPDWTRLDEILPALDALAPGNTAAKAAIDIALHDWLGRRQAAPLHRLWGIDPARPPVTSFTIGLDTPEIVRLKVREAAPYPLLKVKLGRDNDREMIEVIRAETDRPLVVDANQGWTDRDTAARMAEWLAARNVRLIEQPFPHDRPADTAWLRTRCPLPLFADESVHRLADVPSAAGVFDGINIKLMKCTGLAEARRMIARARTRPEGHARVHDRDLLRNLRRRPALAAGRLGRPRRRVAHPQRPVRGHAGRGRPDRPPGPPRHRHHPAEVGGARRLPHPPSLLRRRHLRATAGTRQPREHHQTNRQRDKANQGAQRGHDCEGWPSARCGAIPPWVAGRPAAIRGCQYARMCALGRGLRTAMPAVVSTTVLAEPDWLARRAAHERRVRAWTDPHQARQSRGEKHPVEDFLFEYYSFRPAWLRRWHPGPDVVLLGDAARDFLRWPEYHETEGGVMVHPAALEPRRRETISWLLNLFRLTAERPPHFGCSGLHEWAMVYRQTPEQVRHNAWPLRLPPGDIARIVEAGPLGCTHFDAFRHFTPAARPLNRVQPERATTPLFEQRGCLHANMDLYKWAFKLAPFTPAELTADCFAFARDIRAVDMRASPYDFTALGHPPLAIETPEGRAEYEAHQRAFAGRSQPLRARLTALCERLLAG